MKEIRVIGIGSPFGNDTLGWRAIASLRQQVGTDLLPLAEIELLTADRPGLSLLHLLEGARYVILIDAILDRARHGRILRVDTHQCLLQTDQISSHTLGVVSALVLANKLGMLPEKISMIGLGINEVEATPIPDEAITELTEAVTQELKAYFTTGTRH